MGIFISADVLKLKVMNINYPILIGVIVLVVLLVGYLIWKNQKDEKKFEKDTIDAELPPEKDDKENV
ncbi:hypothetical protein SAMN04488024_1234 [Pedobacter soli]|uniref:LPXTG-motif cell wall anchor domain-containing protein n=2 Tax=Pedobacter soli TaxID=390242 RepID=A0A1G7D4S3_9SPHI|nr:hypothetical protein SAMN04488024_1234 [Pedobacter soli]